MKNRYLIALVFLLLFTTYNTKYPIDLTSNFKIKKIIIENNSVVSKQAIKTSLLFLYEKNLFFLPKNSIEKSLKEIHFIDSLEIKKIYPHTIRIKIFEIKPIAIIQNKQIKNYFTEKGNLIRFEKLEKYKNLPLVFGNSKNFEILYKNLLKINYPIEEIKTFYFFESKRWDLITKKNQTVKLSVKNFENNLKNFIMLKDKHNFEKYKIFDYRISDQLILK